MIKPEDKILLHAEMIWILLWIVTLFAVIISHIIVFVWMGFNNH